MYIKQFYCCSICDSPYESEEQALVCESDPIEKRYDNISNGEIIHFTAEDFNHVSGKVEKAYLVRGTVLGRIISAGDKIHHVTLIARVGNHIRYVLLNKQGSLFSYSHQKFSNKVLDNLNLK